MQGDVGALDPHELGDLVVQARRALGPGPDLDRLAVGADRGSGVHRLHLGVIEVSRAVFAPVDLDGTPHRRLGVTDAFIRDAFAALVAADGGELLKRLLAVVMRARRVAPGDLEQILGGLGGLDAGADDADAFRQLDDVGDALDLPRPRLVHRLRPAARIRRLQHCGVHHAGDLGVDSVFGGAGHLEGHFDPRQILADVAEPRGGLEVLLLDLRQFGRRLGEARNLAIGDAAVRGFVHDDAGLGRKLLRWHAPFRRDCVDEDAPRLSSRDAHRLEVAARRETRRGLERVVVVSRVTELPFVPFGRKHRLDLRPVGVELVGDDCRQRGECALSHLGGGRDDGDRAVGCDREPDVRRQQAVRQGFARKAFAVKRQGIRRHRQSQGETGSGAEKIATAEVGRA